MEVSCYGIRIDKQIKKRMKCDGGAFFKKKVEILDKVKKKKLYIKEERKNIYIDVKFKKKSARSEEGKMYVFD